MTLWQPPRSNFTPPNAIWFQRQDNLEAYMTRVNDEYQIRIHNQYGKLQMERYEKTYSLAMAAVFEFFDSQKSIKKLEETCQ